jgi:hypothetical protein
MTPPPDPKQLKQSCIRYVNRNTPLPVRLVFLLMGLAALFNPGGVVIEMCVQCVRRRDELPEDFAELFLYLGKQE